jgi:hypothetical protein
MGPTHLLDCLTFEDTTVLCRVKSERGADLVYTAPEARVRACDKIFVLNFYVLYRAIFDRLKVAKLAKKCPVLTWICLTAGGYVRSDASDLMLAHSHSHK